MRDDEDVAQERYRLGRIGFWSSCELNSAREAEAECVDKLGRKLAEACGEGMELVGPIRGLKRALCVDQDVIVGWVSRELGEHLPEIGEGGLEDSGCLLYTSRCV